MGYTPSFTPQYEGGWEDLPLETTPIVADALNNYDDAIEDIEDYLASDESQSNLADAYDETATYEAGNYRIHNGDLYKCLEDIDTPEEWDSTKWERCLITEEMATSGGTTVVANPSGTATETLTKLQVENTIYGVSGGGGNANIWTGTQAEYEQQASQIENGTLVNITDDEEYAKSIFQWGTPTFTSDAQLKTVGDEMAIDFNGFVGVYISPSTSQNEVYLTIEKKNTNYRYGACWYHSGYYVSLLIPVIDGDTLRVINMLNVSKVDVSTYPFA